MVEAEAAIGHAQTKFDDEGTLVDAALREELQDAVDLLVAELPVGRPEPVALA